MINRLDFILGEGKSIVPKSTKTKRNILDLLIPRTITKMQERIGQNNQLALASNSLFGKGQNIFISNFLKFSSSVCAVAGGVILSSNTPVSKYGFILLALSSSQIFISSSLTSNKGLMLYSASLFIFVDCLGIYRWLLY